jgi:pantothenate kinase
MNDEPAHLPVPDASRENIYLPLLAMLDVSAKSDRVLAGLAGIPGSGKSTFAAALAGVATRVLGSNALVVVGMDGWHWPNAVLDARMTRERKGGPDSFDTAGMVEALGRLGCGDRPVAVPVYDRTVHEPVADARVVPAEARIVLVEGNYVLGDTPPWDAVSRLLSPKLYLECDGEVARRRVIARHVRGGMTQAEAETKYERNDRINGEIVAPTADRADVRIRLEPEASLTWARS